MKHFATFDLIDLDLRDLQKSGLLLEGLKNHLLGIRLNAPNPFSEKLPLDSQLIDPSANANPCLLEAALKVLLTVLFAQES